MGISDPEVRKKLAEPRWLQYKHESEKQSWPWWRRLLHHVQACPTCRPKKQTPANPPSSRQSGHKRGILVPRLGKGRRGREAHNNSFRSAVIRDVVLRWNAPTDHKQNQYNYPHFHSELLVLALASVTLNWGRKAGLDEFTTVSACDPTFVRLRIFRPNP